MAISLLDLPNEILASICSFLDADNLRPGSVTKWEYTNCKSSLCALCLVNRRLSQIAQCALCESISLHIESSASSPACPTGLEDMGWKFPTYCLDYPSILEDVKSFRVCWYCSAPSSWARRFFNAISVGPHLIHFRIDGFDDGSRREDRLEILATLVRRLRNLELFVIDIKDLKIPPRMVLDICSMRRLRRFETESSIEAFPAEFKTPTLLEDSARNAVTQHSPETSLENLRCSGKYIDLEVLKYVISRSPRLKKLTLSFPGPGVISYSEYEYPREIATEGIFRPHLMTRTLIACSSTLEELIIANPDVQMPLDDATSIDLTSFHKLQRLTLSSRLLCMRIKHEFQSRPNETIMFDLDTLYQHLPTGLQSLEIRLESSNGLLWDTDDLHYTRFQSTRLVNNSHRDASQEDWNAAWRSEFETRTLMPELSVEIEEAGQFWQLSWIMNLARDARTKFPHLSTIKAIETESTGASHWKWERIDLVRTYPEAFTCPGVDLELSVRVPDGYVMPSIEKLQEWCIRGENLADLPLSDGELSD